MGAKVIGIIERVELINEEGFTFEEIRSLFLTRMVINWLQKT
jgi:hypothetical protein